MHRFMSMALVGVQIAKLGESPFTPLDIQKKEKIESGQIISIEDIETTISNLFYLGYLSEVGKGKYKYDETGRDLQTGKIKRRSKD